MNYALVGCGRMGRAVEVEAGRRGHRRVAAIDGRGGGLRDAGQLGGARVAFEFTRAEAAAGNVLLLLRAGVSVVCGTTGWVADEPALDRTARGSGAALVLASNFSLGMNVFLRVVRTASEQFARLGRHDPFVLEAHHREKRDAPSGTARILAEIVVAADGRFRGAHDWASGQRPEPDRLSVSSVRAGHEPGTHTVGFDGEHDRIELTHRARGQAGFGLGAVVAAERVVGRAGLHRFDELLDEILDPASDGADASEEGR